MFKVTVVNNSVLQWNMITIPWSVMLTPTTRYSAGKFGVFRWESKVLIQFGEFHSYNDNIPGYLRNYMRCHDLVPHRLCWVCGDESDASAKVSNFRAQLVAEIKSLKLDLSFQPLSDVSLHQHDCIQLRDLLGHFKSFEVHVQWSRSRAKRQCHQRKHPATGIPRGRNNF